MNEEIKNATILGKTVRPDKAQMLKQVQHDMGVQDDMVRVQDEKSRFRRDFGALAPEKNLSPFTSHFSRKSAFTLAEVLITLGIIGVVAALTIPSLIQKHKKQVVISTLKKASSEIGQAYQLGRAREGYIGVDPEGFQAENPDKAEEMFKKYYSDLKALKLEKGKQGLFAHLADGTVLYFKKEGCGNEPVVGQFGSCAYMYVCLNDKACDKIRVDESHDGLNKITGKDIFIFYVNGVVPKENLKVYNRSTLVYRCKNGLDSGSCTALIFYDGWDIKDDYPIKF